MRRTVSASNSATLSWRMRPQARAAGVSGMVSVTTSSSSAEAEILSIAAPDSTGWVQYATTFKAPCCLSAAAAAQSGPAVSTMSSTSTQVVPETSPKMFITVATLAFGRRLSMIAKRLDDADLAIIDKRRPKANVATVMNIIGDVAGKTCVLVDDIVDTAGTLCAAAAALKQHGALKVVAYCTHPVLSGAAIDNISGSMLDELVVTDTIPLTAAARACGRIRQLSVAELLAETVRRIAMGESVSTLYVD